MRKFLFLPLLALFAACGNDDEECTSSPVKPNELVTPALYASMDDASAYTGPLEVIPCQPNGSVYVGNYSPVGLPTVFPAYYSIVNGVGKSGNSPLRLPVGEYNIVYWGYPSYFNTLDAAFTNPALSIGEELHGTAYGLRKVLQDTVYYPVHDLVFGTQSINIGNEQLQAHLKRATAALGVVVSNTNEQAFSAAIDSMWIYIGGVYNELNYYTAEPQSDFKTVTFGLSPSTDRIQFLKEFASIFPSAPTPLFQIFVKLKNGAVKHYQQKLTTQLSAGTKTTISLSMDGFLLEEGSTGGFQVDKWKEQNEHIQVPPLN